MNQRPAVQVNVKTSFRDKNKILLMDGCLAFTVDVRVEVMKDFCSSQGRNLLKYEVMKYIVVCGSLLMEMLNSKLLRV